MSHFILEVHSRKFLLEAPASSCSYSPAWNRCLIASWGYWVLFRELIHSIHRWKLAEALLWVLMVKQRSLIGVEWKNFTLLWCRPTSLWGIKSLALHTQVRREVLLDEAPTDRAFLAVLPFELINLIEGLNGWRLHIPFFQLLIKPGIHDILDPMPIFQVLYRLSIFFFLDVINVALDSLEGRGLRSLVRDD